MTRDEVIAAAREALRAARWARRAGWRPITALYLADAARCRHAVVRMRRAGMPCLPYDVRLVKAVYPLF